MRPLTDGDFKYDTPFQRADVARSTIMLQHQKNTHVTIHQSIKIKNGFLNPSVSGLKCVFLTVEDPQQVKD